MVNENEQVIRLKQDMEGVPYTDREGQELNIYTTNAIVVEQIKNFIDQGKVWNQLRDGI